MKVLKIMLMEDIQLKESDIQSLSNSDAIASLFTTLGYDVDRLIQTPAALGITNDTLIRQIQHIEQIAFQDGELYIYLFEMKSMRVTDRQALATTFRNAEGEYLLILTSDYESLDFVLLERVEPRDKAGNLMTRKSVIVQQHVLTVNRRVPGRVAQRVLRRFTFTEEDVLYQLDKLLSAYTVAQWSRPMFNNRALFADYFLEHRLTDTSEWGESSQSIYSQLQSLLANIRSRLGNAREEQTRDNLLEPIFETLGFTWSQRQSSGENIQPDYVLTTREHDTPLAYALTYRWNRYLDGRDMASGFNDNGLDAQKYDDNPGARVVSLLAEEDAPPFIIVTNGKLWRLYAKEAHSRATNYYEIDLEETLNDPDRDVSIKYFWLFFRAGAFVPVETQRDGEMRPMSFLDRVMAGSSDYAKELEDRLKDRVFEQIFPQFAEGFIRYGWGKETPTQDELDQVYQATLTFLYRMMFLLYAEARDLLPMKEARGYAEISLKSMKEAIAEKAGVLLDVANDKLHTAYSPSSTDLYDQLTQLFTVIDKGDNKLNVPNYNGGLFVTDPSEGDTSPDAMNARFLRDTKIPDRFLAIGIDRLARDLGQRAGEGLVAIDYKSLGVRQLGSIYEGLLEFKLRVAPEKLAIIKGKRTEEVVPYKKAKKKDIVTTGRGDNKQEKTLAKGDVYLENTKQERKASGSYYTPDYIVKYIVQHTVGPVLDEKFEKLTPRLREAEKRYYQAVQNNRAKAKSGMETRHPSLVWNDEAMQELAADVLDVKVLDPAMGSGHFLVEVVDFVTDRTLQFLDRFRYNPVQAQLQRVRDSILDNMDNQGVNIDEKRLTDVNLLKRQVLKRCVYGVDLNRMAVELAKVSLWLDAFTLGAPLSFLDHHLRWGNSLIGTMARDADKELRGEGGQLTLFSGPFVGLLQAAEVMRGVSALADATIEEAHQSARLFEQFEEAAKPYKQLLDIFVIQHFGVKKASEFLTLYGADAMDARRGKVARGYDAVLDQREELYQQYRFFHWDLEFPEVFIDLGKAEWKENAGFDAIVGNPPWVDVQEIEDTTKGYLRQIYQSAKGKFDLYGVFVERANQQISNTGLATFIFQSKFLVTNYGESLRSYLSENIVVNRIFYTGISDIFPNITTYPFILTTSRKTSDNPPIDFLVTYIPATESVFDFNQAMSDTEIMQKYTFAVADEVIRTQEPWILEPLALTRMAGRILDACKSFSDYTTSISYGVKTNRDDAYLESREHWIAEGIEEELLYPAVKPRDLNRYEVDYNARWIIFPYHFNDGILKPIELSQYPNAERHFKRRKDDLLKRLFFGKTVIEQGLEYFELPYTSSYSRDPKLAFPKVTNRALFAVDLGGDAVFVDPCYVVSLREIGRIMYLAAILNSKLTDIFLKRRSTSLANDYTEMMKQYVEDLPIYPINFTTPQERREQLAEKGRKLYQRCLSEGHACVLEFVAHHLAQDETDVIHDLLAFLAQQMIDLNKEKQAEMSRFLGWLEGNIGAKVDDLSGKTYIQGYIGDYQKDEPEYSPDELIDRLTMSTNRRKMSANIRDKALQGKIRVAYEQSLAALRPIKAQLQTTDDLIDQVVYMLYGLTEDEIAIVEGRG